MWEFCVAFEGRVLKGGCRKRGWKGVSWRIACMACPQPQSSVRRSLNRGSTATRCWPIFLSTLLVTRSLAINLFLFVTQLYCLLLHFSFFLFDSFRFERHDHFVAIGLAMGLLWLLVPFPSPYSHINPSPKPLFLPMLGRFHYARAQMRWRQ